MLEFLGLANFTEGAGCPFLYSCRSCEAVARRSRKRYYTSCPASYQCCSVVNPFHPVLQAAVLAASGHQGCEEVYGHLRSMHCFPKELSRAAFPHSVVCLSAARRHERLLVSSTQPDQLDSNRSRSLQLTSCIVPATVTRKDARLSSSKTEAGAPDPSSKDSVARRCLWRSSRNLVQGDAHTEKECW